MNTPASRLLNAARRISIIRPGTARIGFERAAHVDGRLASPSRRRGCRLVELDRTEVDERGRRERATPDIGPTHAEAADGEAAEDRREGERHAGHGADHPVGPVAALFRDEQGHAGRSAMPRI